MSQIDWKKEEAEVKHLYTLLLYTFFFSCMEIFYSLLYIVGNTQLANNDW